MTSERLQRRIDAFLDEAEEALGLNDWTVVEQRASAVLTLDPENADAKVLLQAVDRGRGVSPRTERAATPARVPSVEQPTSFVAARYAVRRFLGEGGKKKVFLAHDERLDRDVAFALIKADGLDEVGRERITREAQAVGRLGAHPHVVTIFEIGEEDGAPYVVTELLGGGDVEAMLADGPPPLARTLEIAKGVTRGLAFAHEQGLVHRDLKPGNVWLTTNGVAKIGDFGLAVALDRSRLTTHGLMVGTVAYMPPEQALGGEVTPQADLYSLGAMLYELVTGKPPFAGDNPTAIISQHINTPPVAPSWNSDHCPPDLEALILKLLAKVPADRPSSALEVLAALEAIDPEAPSVRHSDSSANPLDRLARGVFVGRERELERLRSAFDEAFAGRGSVVMLVGEPGIGKTRTSLELETYARMRGGRVIWGRAHEAAGAPPYRPWVQAADTYSSMFGLEAIIGQLSVEDTGELSRIFPLLRQQRGYVAPPEILDQASGQFRLFEAYTKLIRAFASEAPLVVVLDDLHWADKPTLLLLQHVARELARLRVLIVGTYRDTELSRTHPLAETLAELNRESGFLRINLGGLSRDDTSAYIRATAGFEPAPALVDRVHAETEGNPFFLAQVVNLMTEEGTLSRRSVSDISIPEGVREALGRRLDRLSEDANALLAYAAVAGREFSYDTLALLAEHDDDALLRLIEEGLAARVIEETGRAGGYRFTHALMQETLLAELSTTRRVRMHGQVGEAIERRLGDRAEEQAPRLAQHFGESASLNVAHTERALRYSELAGRQAEAKSAWQEAARHFEAALSVAATHREPGSTDVARLHVAAGRNLTRANEQRSAWRHLLTAIDVYRSTGDSPALRRAVLLASAVNAPGDRLVVLIDSALASAGGTDPELDSRLLAAKAWALVKDGRTDEARALTEQMRSDHETSTSAGVNGYLALVDAHVALQTARHSDALPLFREASELLRQAGDELAADAWGYLGYVTVALGRLDEGRAHQEAALQFARERGYVTHEQSIMVGLCDIGLLRCDLDEVRRISEAVPLAPNNLRYQPLIVLAEFDGSIDLTSVMPPLEVSGGVTRALVVGRGLRARALFAAGKIDQAREELAEWAPLGTRLQVTWAGRIGPAVAAIDDPILASDLYKLINHQVQTRVTCSSSADAFRGFLALKLGLVDEAEQHFRTGLEWCERERCPVEAGRCNQGLADVADRRGDLAAAREHLDAAGALFARHGAKLYLDQVLAKKQVLGA